jgi:hypothetical protein
MIHDACLNIGQSNYWTSDTITTTAVMAIAIYPGIFMVTIDIDCDRHSMSIKIDHSYLSIRSTSKRKWVNLEMSVI